MSDKPKLADRIPNEWLLRVICLLLGAIGPSWAGWGSQYAAFLKDAATRQELREGLTSITKSTGKAITEAMKTTPWIQERSGVTEQLRAISTNLSDMRDEFKSNVTTLQSGQTILLERVSKIEGSLKKRFDQ